VRSKVRLSLSDVFAVASVGAVLGAIGANIAAGFYRMGLVAAIPFLFNACAFLTIFLGIGLFFNAVRPYTGKLGPWLVLPVLGGAAGFFAPFAIGLLFVLFPIPGGIGGAIGGVAAAGTWGYAERHPGQLSKQPEDAYQVRPLTFVLLGLGIAVVMITIVETSWTR
jgi:hypothetical protein